MPVQVAWPIDPIVNLSFNEMGGFTESVALTPTEQMCRSICRSRNVRRELENFTGNVAGHVLRALNIRFILATFFLGSIQLISGLYHWVKLVKFGETQRKTVKLFHRSLSSRWSTNKDPAVGYKIKECGTTEEHDANLSESLSCNN